MQSDRALPYLELIDWWEESRWAATVECEGASRDLKTYAIRATANLPKSHLLQSRSSERDLIETHIARRIQACEEALLNSITSLITDHISVNPSPISTTYEGWSYWDLGRVLVGGSAPAAVAVLGTRAAAGAVAALGTAVIAAPLTVTVGLAGVVWGAYSAAEAKRSDYSDALSAMIDKALLSLDGPESSVLSRQFSRLDRIVQQQEASI